MIIGASVREGKRGGETDERTRGREEKKKRKWVEGRKEVGRKYRQERREGWGHRKRGRKGRREGGMNTCEHTSSHVPT